ncbi:hypothetical protein [Streptomyces tagetis]|uniref:NIF system FeS cluster assembly NifU C-terminal domain-containing protein n=1 Tax=Streptomyces tagetis TaxID=2820809 RepID=A0A940XG06_9ACTN|nr:hypothetical protein [Streptomyces sp. RG38]MBQ0826442.1 hypothetical protein [Streptomyces sp. RG38]
MSGARSGSDAERAGRMVEEVLDRLTASGDRAAVEAAEELVRLLMEFYGAGLARTMELLGRDPGARAGGVREALLSDELVAGLLVLHGLHPQEVPERIARALDGLGQPVENAGFDAATGELRLRTSGSGGCGCGGSLAAVEQAARDALACLVPEVTRVVLEEEAGAPVLLQIGAAPPAASGTCGRPPAPAAW